MTVLELYDLVKAGTLGGLEALQHAWAQIPEIARTLLSAAAGVVFGAWVASRAQTKRTIVAELHALRTAHALCFSIANKSLSLKKQHLRPLKRTFEAALARHEAYVANPSGVFALQIDLRTISQVDFPIAALEKTLIDKCFLGSEGIATLVAVTDAVYDLKHSLTLRNTLIEDFRQKPPATHEQRVARYFGLFFEDHRDERLRDNVEALYAQADHCIFFARRLSDHVLSSENKLRSKNRWKYRLPGKRLKPAHWARAERDDLLPLDEDYQEWTTGFVKDSSVLDRFMTRMKKVLSI